VSFFEKSKTYEEVFKGK